jgi:recombination protein RecA
MAKKTKEKKETSTPQNIQELTQMLENDFGSGVVIYGKGSVAKVNTFSSGVASIDRAVGCGGIPQGRIIELYGAEGSGKTTTCLQMIAACQQHEFQNKQRRGVAALMDAEHALDPTWAGKVGVNMEELLISQPSSGEEAFQIIERMVISGLVDLIVVDSVAALAPKAELDGEIGDHHVGAQARMMSQALRKLKGIMSKSQTTVIFINQIREKVGTMFGNPETTPGGRALKFYASIRAEIFRGSMLKDGDAVVGFRPSLKIVKNKVARPFEKAHYDICVGHPSRPVYGIDHMASLLELAGEHKIVTKKGNFISFNKKTLGNGPAKAAECLRNDPALAAEIKRQTYSVAFNEVQHDTEPEGIDGMIKDEQ